MSSAKGAAAKPGATAAAPPEPTGPMQTTVLLVQVEALAHDETIRSELKKRGFTITTQTLVYLSLDAAREFVVHVSNAESPQYAKSHITSEAEDPTTDTDPPMAAGGSTSSASSTPRDKVATPRSPRPVAAVVSKSSSISSPSSSSSSPSPAQEEAIHGLARGPVLMLVLERLNAVAELLEIVGPETPEMWQTAPFSSSFRARFGVDTARCGVRCTAHETTSASEVEFLLRHTSPHSSASSSSSSSASSPAHSKASSSFSSSSSTALVELSQLLDFLFPPHVLHANSTGRLFVFGLYGPLDAHAQLRSGEKRLHVVTDRELDTMASRMEREDLLAVYGMLSLSQHEEEEVLRTVDNTLKAFPRYTRRDVDTLFASAARTAASSSSTPTTSSVSFHALQHAILTERVRRVLCMKERMHPALAAPIRNQFRHTLTRSSHHQSSHKSHGEIAPSAMFLKDVGATGAENATLVARLLSSHSFQICHLDDGNAPELTQNVRLLRDHGVDPRDPRTRWDVGTRVPSSGQLRSNSSSSSSGTSRSTRK